MIPARGGSKRIPRKNIKDFRGKPIIAYSIEAALKSGCFDKVIVSTDDKEIAEIAKQYGAEIPFLRPSNISDDHATTVDVIKHCLNWFNTEGYPISELCCIYATAPFIDTQSIQEGKNKLENDSVSYAFTATSYPFPIQRAMRVGHDETVEMFSPKEMQTRSQDLPEAFHDAGQLYWGKSEAFLQDIPIFSKHAKVILLPSYKVQDIDTPDDWLRAEAMHETLEKMGEL